MSLIADTYHHKLTNQHHIQMLTLYSNTHLNYRRIIEKNLSGNRCEYKNRPFAKIYDN